MFGRKSLAARARKSRGPYLEGVPGEAESSTKLWSWIASSPITRRVYSAGRDEFIAWYGQAPRHSRPAVAKRIGSVRAKMYWAFTVARVSAVPTTRSRLQGLEPRQRRSPGIA